jgi:transaldolase/glucose-6-phosphate isomerase
MKNSELLHQFGQSIWYDNIQRRLLQNGELAQMIQDREIFGVTSNPSIFQNAIAKTTDYDSALKPMAWAGWNANDMFWQLAIDDIREAADLFKPLYDETSGGDGYVSLEVNPLLAHDSENTLKQAIELWQRVDRENLMIKIPATKEGVVAVEKAIAEGLNINVTLIFSLERYQEIINAYLRGLEKRVSQGKSIEQIASVASFFVSRVDTKVDPLLQSIIDAGGINSSVAKTLLGTIAISNSKLAYALFKKNFLLPRFEKLSKKGGRIQRPLWASTSTKNPKYKDVLYIEELIGPDTVNTIPPQTLKAFLDHGKAELSIEKGLNVAKENLRKLAEIGIRIEQVTGELEDEGVKSFSDAFTSLIQTISDKGTSAVTELGSLVKSVIEETRKATEKSSIKRLFEVDPTLWTTDPQGQEEIRKRCAWLNAPWSKFECIPDGDSLLNHCKEKGFTHALLLGMGGSSLAPEVLRQINGVTKRNEIDGLDLAILDSTDPVQVQEALDRSAVENTLFIVSSKSGNTAEVNAYFDFFWGKTEAKVGKEVGDHFIAITDPGTKLESLAEERKFWHTYFGDPMVGGRNSALTAFGLVPAALIGMDVDRLLLNARNLADQCVPEVPFGANPGAMLGVVLGSAWKAGKDKLTVITDPDWNSFGSWLEQLVAESSGKQGKGIIPIAQEPLIEANLYGKDRLFVYLRSSGENAAFSAALRKAGQPVLEFTVTSAYDLGGQFYLWEIATAIACSILQVNSFDQPDVQDNKNRTVKKIEGFRKDGKLSDYEPNLKLGQNKVFGAKNVKEISGKTINEVILKFLQESVQAGDFIAINAYLPRNPKNLKALTELRKQILNQFKAATALGFGPRFLHSTGQLHKGGPNSGVFVQITADTSADLEIPTEGITFGTLERAQAIGDFEALEARGRRVIRIQLPEPDAVLLLK